MWTGALLGVVLQTVWPHAPRWLTVPCYIALGWVAVFVMPQLLHSAGVAALVLIAAGGIIYTIGGIVYGIKRPNPVPGVFGFHEVFHACTLVAALLPLHRHLARCLQLSRAPPGIFRPLRALDCSVMM